MAHGAGRRSRSIRNEPVADLDFTVDAGGARLERTWFADGSSGQDQLREALQLLHQNGIGSTVSKDPNRLPSVLLPVRVALRARIFRDRTSQLEFGFPDLTPFRPDGVRDAWLVAAEQLVSEEVVRRLS
jgi:hypothetical protein